QRRGGPFSWRSVGTARASDARARRLSVQPLLVAAVPRGRPRMSRPAEALDPDPRDLALMRGYPGLPWLRPVLVHRIGDDSRGWGCRLCIAHHGLMSDVDLFLTELEVVEHLHSFHRLDVR